MKRICASRVVLLSALLAAGGSFAGPVVPVEWVESTGRQYVDIGLKGESGLKAEIDMAWTDPSGDKVFMGCSSGTANAYCGNIWFLGTHNVCSWATRGLYNGYRNSVSYAQVFPAASNRIVYTSIIDPGLQQLATNGVAVFTARVADAFDTAVGYSGIEGIEGGWNIYVFANHSHASGSDASAYNAYARCYGIKVWKKAVGNTTPGDYADATLVRDLKPAVKDLRAGLWDEVTQTFYDGRDVSVASKTLLYPSETYEWTGAGGDGKWSNPANWKVGGVVATKRPYNLCSLLFGAAASGESTNDIEDLWIEKMTFANASPVTLRGEPIHLLGAGCVMPCETGFASIAIHNALYLTQDDQSLGSDKSCAAGATVGFYGDIHAEGLSFAVNFENDNKNDRTVDFYGRVTAAAVWFSKLSGAQCYYHFHSSSNAIGYLTTNWGFGPCYDAENALTADTVLSFDHSKPENHINCQDHYLNADQIANRISSDPLPAGYYNMDHIQCYDTKKAFTLTLRGSADAVTYCDLEHQISLVWDPVGDYTQTFCDRIHTTTGSLTVKGGTLRSGGTNAFPKVRALTIAAGATFDAASTNSGLFAACKEVVIGDGGRLLLGGGVTNAFPADVCVTLSSGARIVLADDTPALSLGSVLVDGIPLAAGDYTGTGGASGTVIPQIVGTVKVSVAESGTGTFWKGAASDAFNVAENWTAGVPSLACPGIIGKYGTYTVRLDDPATPTVGDLTLSIPSFDDGERTLEISTAATVAGTLTLRTGGRLAVTSAGSLTLAKEPVMAGGGKIDVTGTLVTTNVTSSWLTFTGTDLTLSGNGQWQQCATQTWVRLAFNSQGGTNLFEIADNGRFDTSVRVFLSNVYLNNENADGVMGLKLSGNGYAWLGRMLAVANGADTRAFIEVNDSAYVANRYYPATFGWGGGSAEKPAVGELIVRGGCFEQRSANNEESNVSGLILGRSDAGEGVCGIGRIYLEDGVVSNTQNGVVYLGLGPARGEIHQTGGRFIGCQTAQKHYEQTLEGCERPFILGMCGGEGLWEMSGGYAECARAVYVGGCTADILGKLAKYYPTQAPATGALSISGGLFKVNLDVVVAYWGAGTVTIGAAGELKAANLRLVDPEDASCADLGATLAFHPVGTSSGKVTLTGGLTLGARARIVVDAADWTREESGFVTLLQAGEALPALGDRLVVRNLPPKCQVVVQGNRLRLGFTRGTCVVIR